MKELKCPKCGSTFTVDEADYALLLSQVKNSEFEMELARRLHDLEQAQNARLLAEKQAEHARQQAELAQREQLYTQQLAQNQQQLQAAQAQLQQAEQQKQLAVAQVRQQATEAYMKKEQELATLRTQAEQQLKAAQEQIAYYKDMKLRLSTKMVGETLEQHCATEFARIRPLFPNAYFEKDNEVVEGTKGDFVFRDSSEDGVEYVSIMFEMKNENDETATKHKNEDFLKKLDDDRRKKGCEYAVLVSLLEPENELYNGGIVDMSHRFEKMYVIRPQFFVPLITLLCQTSRKSLEAKRELALVKAQQVDVTNFEEKLSQFKEGFGRNVRLANERFQDAIDEIDKTIAHLTKVRENLIKSGDNLNAADKKLQDVTIKRLTYNNPTMKAKFDEAGLKNQE
ncbi:MAG: DUF2130 domain-containing protein [Paludibacteraceae bacterium]|nr:DUF2130 domain-containing protein [Paludibacteraceae bacterium]MBQ9296580.1 DUF2130 domain-containing protein [Paludibacteraceae bacterium]